MVTTIYAIDDKPVMNYSSLIDDALLKLRKELRSDLSEIAVIDWGDNKDLLYNNKNSKMDKQKL